MSFELICCLLLLHLPEATPYQDFLASVHEPATSLVQSKQSGDELQRFFCNLPSLLSMKLIFTYQLTPLAQVAVLAEEAV